MYAPLGLVSGFCYNCVLFSLADYSIPKAASNDTEVSLVQKVGIYSMRG